jgi:hypothetical protein
MKRTLQMTTTLVLQNRDADCIHGKLDQHPKDCCNRDGRTLLPRNRNQCIESSLAAEGFHSSAPQLQQKLPVFDRTQNGEIHTEHDCTYRNAANEVTGNRRHNQDMSFLGMQQHGKIRTSLQSLYGSKYRSRMSKSAIQSGIQMSFPHSFVCRATALYRFQNALSVQLIQATPNRIRRTRAALPTQVRVDCSLRTRDQISQFLLSQACRQKLCNLCFGIHHEHHYHKCVCISQHKCVSLTSFVFIGNTNVIDISITVSI